MFKVGLLLFIACAIISGASGQDVVCSPPSPERPFTINTTEAYEHYRNCTSFDGNVIITCTEGFEPDNSTTRNTCPWADLPDLKTVHGFLSFVGTWAQSLPVVIPDFPLLERADMISFMTLFGLKEVPTFPKLTSLRKLSSSSTGLESVSWRSFPLCDRVNEIQMNNMESLQSLTAFNKSTLLTLMLNGVSQLRTVAPFTQLTTAAQIQVAGYRGGAVNWFPALKKINGTEGQAFSFTNSEITSLSFPALETAVKLTIAASTVNTMSFPRLRSLPALSLRVDGLQDLTGFAALTSLDSLSVSSCGDLRSLDGLQGLTVLRTLTIASCPSLTSLSGLDNVVRLEKENSIFASPASVKLQMVALTRLAPFNPTVVPDMFSITMCDSLETIDLPALTSVGELSLTSLPLVRSLSGLGSLAQISDRLALVDMRLLSDISSLSRIAQLRYINIRGTALRSLSDLRVSSEVSSIVLRDNEELADLRGICSIPSVQSMDLSVTAVCCQSAQSIMDAIEPQSSVLTDCLLVCDTNNNLTCPCRANSCYNGGVCSSLSNGYSCSCPLGFTGSRCQHMHPTLHDLTPRIVSSFDFDHTSSSRSSVPTFTLTAQHLPQNKSNIVVRMHGVRANITAITLNPNPEKWDPKANSATAIDQDKIYDIQFTVPGLFITTSAAYLPVSIANRNKPEESSVRPDLVYFTTFDCAQIGYRWDYGSGRCVACPTGSYCPGGDRMWPLRGYWSPDELTVPVKCAIYEACPGAMGEMDEYGAIPLDKGGLKTDNCALGEGYRGEICTVCESGFFAESARCRPCGLDDQDRKEMIGLVSAALAFFFVIALGVSFLHDTRLADLVSALIVVQQFTVVGSTAAAHMGESVGRVFSVLSILNFDIQFVKAGCSVPRLQFVSVFWYTMLVFVVAVVVFVVAAAVRSRFVSAEVVWRQGVSRVKIFKRRVVHSLIILSSITYLQFCIRALQGLDCQHINGRLVLKIEPSTECYTDSHLPTAMFIWVLMFVYIAGFPVWCFYIVHRTATIEGDRGLANAKRVEKYGYLYRGTKQRFYWFRVLSFLTNFALALQTVLADQVSLKTFLASLLFVVNVAFVTYCWPFRKWYTNLAAIMSGVANVIQVLFYLSLIDDRTNNQEAYFYITLSLGIVGTVCGVGRLVYVFHTGNYKDDLAETSPVFDDLGMEMGTESAEGEVGDNGSAGKVVEMELSDNQGNFAPRTAGRVGNGGTVRASLSLRPSSSSSAI